MHIYTHAHISGSRIYLELLAVLAQKLVDLSGLGALAVLLRFQLTLLSLSFHLEQTHNGKM